MIPAKHANALYFTPRTPWGTRVPRRALRSHMQASEDTPAPPYKKPDLTSKSMQGLGGQMAPNQFGGSQDASAKALEPLKTSAPPGLSGQTTPERIQESQDKSIKLPPYSMPRQEVPNSTSSPTPAYTLQGATGAGVLKRPPTEQEKQNELIQRFGGAQNIQPIPENKPESWWKKLPKPHFDFYKGRLEGVDLEMEHPL